MLLTKLSKQTLFLNTGSEATLRCAAAEQQQISVFCLLMTASIPCYANLPMHTSFHKLTTAFTAWWLQVIFNLLGNALKFTTEGYIRVTVKPLPAAGVGMDMVQLSVEDTGCGIAKDKQKLIFEAFGQV